DFLWEKLDEAPFDVEEFGDLFCKAPVKKKVSTEKQVPRKKTKEVAKILDGKRSQAVGIFISSAHITSSDIESALLDFDPSILSVEVLQTLYEQRASPAELSDLEAHLKAKPDTTLDRPEQ
ncbi:hypothetical protein CAPTEDRAFT_206185, partial [Capitella teleta]